MTETFYNSPVFCKEINKDGHKCRKRAKKNNTLCDLHIPENICEGVTNKGSKCRGRKMKGSKYCRHDHDPNFIQIVNPISIPIGNHLSTLEEISLLGPMLLNQEANRKRNFHSKTTGKRFEVIQDVFGSIKIKVTSEAKRERVFSVFPIFL